AATCLVGAATFSPVASASSDTVLRVAITHNGLYLNGPTSFPAGRVRLVVDASGADRCTEVMSFASGYTFADFRADNKIIGENLFGPGGDKKKGLAALNHA